IPGLMTAAQNSGSPLPLPMRVSAGMAVTDLCGKTRMYRRPSPRTECVAVMRPASMASALSQPPSTACKPKSPWLTVLPRQALPRTFPRWVLRYFTRFGISGMIVLLIPLSPEPRPQWQFPPPLRLETPITVAAQLLFLIRAALLGRDLGPAPALPRLFLGSEIIAVVDPHLDADVALGRLGFGKAVFDLGPQGGQGDAAGHATLRAGHFCTAQPAGQLNTNPLGPRFHRCIDSALHSAAKAGPLLQLLGNVFRHQLRIPLRPVNLQRLDLDVPVRQIFQILGQFIDFLAFLTDNHADASGVNEHRHLFARPLNTDFRYTRAAVALFDELADLGVFHKKIGKILLVGVPVAQPIDHDAGAKARRSRFLSHGIYPLPLCLIGQRYTNMRVTPFNRIRRASRAGHDAFHDRSIINA